ncbi:hypothetical protein K493DRAFT_393550 [Basidiobolus meristosporus CBS 931.73]|uniref:Uncharacterized protein n=1 Tax=Basidiobolus meristosporus CBS 931.73 TaxID=1314790 RepID=A0A1Y1YNX6_9FUNG|nr:hypothetical protein K493DRAFT_366490 [Basidiobolus meristosporus CBS 931.73]ORX99533.1 hypothetical protein K493DRAFT_393550 [Basidiobolus meristosporus CBS 931.73]|eukprot:ORX73420.1 hypothetical protein K493DRAFT_366490 [Basidiobolus meristosporus CBS 931.73]
MKFKSLLLAVTAGLFLSVKNTSASGLWIFGSGNGQSLVGDAGPSYTGFVTSVEVPAGYDPEGTYYCAAGWYLGYFGLQSNPGDVHDAIFTVWNMEDNVPPEVLETYPNAQVEWCQSDDCAEGRAVQINVVPDHDFWKPGTKYWLMAEMVKEGNDVIYTASIFKDGQWHIFGKVRGPNYAKMSVPVNYYYQFLEDFVGNTDAPRRVTYGNQFYRLEGSEKWGPMEYFSAQDEMSGVNTTVINTMKLSPSGNSFDLALDGLLPAGKTNPTQVPPVAYEERNIKSLPSFLGIDTIELPTRPHLEPWREPSSARCPRPVLPPKYDPSTSHKDNRTQDTLLHKGITLSYDGDRVVAEGPNPSCPRPTLPPVYKHL